MRGAIGVDIGGTNMRVAFVNQSGEPSHLTQAKTGAIASSTEFVDRIIDMVREVMEKAQGEGREVSGVGMGFPGLVDRKTGLVSYAANLPGWTPIEIKPYMEERLGLPVDVDNDVRMASQGEARWGALQGASVGIFMSIGTGVGGALLFHGELFAGSEGLAGEIGHIIIDPQAVDYQCQCGLVGDLEALTSGEAIGKRARLLMAASTGQSEDIDANWVFANADQHAVAKQCLEQVIEYLAMGLANLANILNPDAIILGGGVATNPLFPIQALREQFQRFALPKIKERAHIDQTRLGPSSGVIGAAAPSVPVDRTP